ncbi:hypothetical protein CYV19_00845 [Natronobacterium gregoryi SP2]|uniref:Uncharacterized protein n=1 Tax=Natronobacterium gregoryi (strain ATCC 43098 / DSM 3393 / CCM 3738 / CIP 104747 / IAM 13177 / JCM 8860 / NBRC 102187 / NCIMB 2189 / SP2) TaxID=797304 RepID=L9XST3_NATGS|nr:hypothetical protein C490_15624 [Natronobacterium gregoryi SP2]PLK21977.1 hypothetical protein CYV19_00845 [Natronobacterium gregoryi SP2]
MTFGVGSRKFETFDSTSLVHDDPQSGTSVERVAAVGFRPIVSSNESSDAARTPLRRGARTG